MQDKNLDFGLYTLYKTLIIKIFNKFNVGMYVFLIKMGNKNKNKGAKKI